MLSWALSPLVPQTSCCLIDNCLHLWIRVFEKLFIPLQSAEQLNPVTISSCVYPVIILTRSFCMVYNVP